MPLTGRDSKPHDGHHRLKFRGNATFRGNLAETRHGWLRLTPAYSVALVGELLDRERGARVLDPFCGTGTTLVACAERGLDCDTLDVNPFLVWLARAKSRSYSKASLSGAERVVKRMANSARENSKRGAWAPPLFHIERWWTPDVLAALSRAWETLSKDETLDAAGRDLARLAFCRALIASARVSFGHQSMSFSKGASASTAARPREERERVAAALSNAFSLVLLGAKTGLPRSRRRVRNGDARGIESVFGDRSYNLVITSPPYCNRMSYIRELRPYMYWLEYLQNGRAAGELDWQAIGGTWGSATSRLNTWEPKAATVPDSVERRAKTIAKKSPVLGQYVRRYFCDVAEHVQNLRPCLERGAKVFYVVGNSTFFDVVVPVERIYAELLAEAGFTNPRVEKLRKRTSKSALYEYLVSATWRK